MNPGKLRHRVTFTREARTPDEGGGAAVAAVDGPTVWANVVPLSTAERARAMTADSSAISHRVEVRYRDDLAPFTAIRHDGRVLDIRAMADPDERRVELHFRCEERR